MGTTKQLLPWPPDSANAQSTVVAASFDLIAAHCFEMIVVLGHDAPAVVEALQPRTFHEVLSDPDAEMMHSIRLGLVAAQRLDHGRPVVLHPADVPAVPPETVNEIVAKASGHRASAVMPEFDGRGGHPVVIPAGLIHSIVTWQGDGGLRRYWDEHPDRRIRVPVDEPAVTRDLDAPGDYAGA